MKQYTVPIHVYIYIYNRDLPSYTVCSTIYYANFIHIIGYELIFIALKR